MKRRIVAVLLAGMFLLKGTISFGEDLSYSATELIDKIPMELSEDINDVEVSEMLSEPNQDENEQRIDTENDDIIDSENSANTENKEGFGGKVLAEELLTDGVEEDINTSENSLEDLLADGVVLTDELSPVSTSGISVLDIDSLITELPVANDTNGTKRYYYRQLNDIEKAIYWQISKCDKNNPSFIIKGLTENQYDAYKAVDALMADDPMVHALWDRNVSIEYDPTYEAHRFTLTSSYGSTDYIVQSSIARAQQIIGIIDGEDSFSKLRKLSIIMADLTKYDDQYVLGGNRRSHRNDSLIGALYYNTAICSGYADTTKYFCNLLDIPCIIVGNNIHAWNFVRMEDGNWYSFDLSAICGWANLVENSYNSLSEYVDSLLLLGNQSDRYLEESNYFQGELKLYSKGFSFPALSPVQYRYSGNKNDTYKLIENDHQTKEGSFIYTINDDNTTCTITDYEGEGTGDLIIPESIDGYKVTVIGDGAFLGHKEFTGNLIIPEGVVQIESGAFGDCTGLSGTLNLPASIEIIEEGAFGNCCSISGTLVLPETIRIIGKNAFSNCTSLSGDLKVPKNISNLDWFFYCPNINGTLYLSDGVEKIDDFYKSVFGLDTYGPVCGISRIEASETSINYSSDDGVLYSKDGKTLLFCPANKEGILHIKEGTKDIAAGACSFCKNLTGVVIPNSVKTIGERAFEASFGFGNTDIIIPDSVETIGDCAFISSGIKSIYFGPNVKKAELPSGCKNLTTVVFKGTDIQIELSYLYREWNLHQEIYFTAQDANCSLLILDESAKEFITVYGYLNSSIAYSAKKDNILFKDISREGIFATITPSATPTSTPSATPTPTPSATPTPTPSPTPTPTPSPTPTPTPSPTPTPTPSPVPSPVPVPKAAITGLKEMSIGKLKMQAQNKGTAVDGYQFKWSLDKSFNTGVKSASSAKHYLFRSGLIGGKTYYVKARTFKIINGKKVYSTWSGTKYLKLNILPPKPAIASLKKNGTGFTVKWKAVSGVGGYQIRYSTASNFSPKKTASVTGASKTSWSKKNLVKGQAYYISVRSYKLAADGTKYYSKWSVAKSIVIK